jgi:hypothetical protein
MADGTQDVRKALGRISIEVSPEAIQRGAKAGGGYLDKLGKSDLATLTREEYHTYCAVVIFNALHEASHDALSGFIRRLESNGNIFTDTIPG